MSTWRLPQASIGGFDRYRHRTDMTPTPDDTQTLPAPQMRTLLNLSERQPGQEANFVNIAAAQALTALGLARHGGGGWEITPQGRNHLLRHSERNKAERDRTDGTANAR
jgi:hypothetical protein